MCDRGAPRSVWRRLTARPARGWAEQGCFDPASARKARCRPLGLSVLFFSGAFVPRSQDQRHNGSGAHTREARHSYLGG